MLRVLISIYVLRKIKKKKSVRKIKGISSVTKESRTNFFFHLHLYTLFTKSIFLLPKPISTLRPTMNIHALISRSKSKEERRRAKKLSARTKKHEDDDAMVVGRSVRILRWDVAGS